MKTKRKTHAFDILTREADEAGPTQIVGYAVVFNTIEHGEMIKDGAFTKTLQEHPDIKAYWGHDRNVILGRTTNGTLSLTQDDTGLYVEITPNMDTTWGRDAMAAISRGDVTQMSFGFTPIKEEKAVVDGDVVYIVKEARLYEVSPVAEPWYSATTADVRDNGEAEPEPDLAVHSTIAAEERERILTLDS